MQPGDLYKNLNNQDRLILGRDPSGKIGYATRGGNVGNDYNSCQVQDQTAFAAAGTFDSNVGAQELDRVREKFASWMTSKDVQ